MPLKFILNSLCSISRLHLCEVWLCPIFIEHQDI
jgi:hypothetical protein